VLFSNETVASVIDKQFEPVWVSLRPVPRVTIDFGNGNVIRRTLHGNVATWICAADGTALDVIPGVYEPETWLRELHALIRVNREFADASKTHPRRFLTNYHQKCLAESTRVVATSDSAEVIAGLRDDTAINQSIRRMAIHRYLQDRQPSLPDAFTPWLYREVLDADLEDPYLGLGEKLFGNYPFAVEDAGYGD